MLNDRVTIIQYASHPQFQDHVNRKMAKCNEKSTTARQSAIIASACLEMQLNTWL